jgi:hypothetical protein
MPSLTHVHAAPLRILSDPMETIGLTEAHVSQRADLCSILVMHFGEFPFHALR